MAVEDRWVIPRSSSISTSHKSVGAHIVGCHTYVCASSAITNLTFAQANKNNKRYLETLSSTSYPLEPTGDPDEIEMPTTPSQQGEIQGHYAMLKGEIEAEGIEKQPFAQR